MRNGYAEASKVVAFKQPALKKYAKVVDSKWHVNHVSLHRSQRSIVNQGTAAVTYRAADDAKHARVSALI